MPRRAVRAVGLTRRNEGHGRFSMFIENRLVVSQRNLWVHDRAEYGGTVARTTQSLCCVAFQKFNALRPVGTDENSPAIHRWVQVRGNS